MDTARFQDTLVKAGNILIVLPKEPTFDMTAGALSLYGALANYGKKVSVFCSSPMLVEFNQLVGIDRVSQELGSKNLTITLGDYPADHIERVSYNIENGQMQLTIIPKQGVEAPTASQIVSSYGGVSADLVIFVGVEDDGQVGDGTVREELRRAPQSVLILHGSSGVHNLSAQSPMPQTIVLPGPVSSLKMKRHTVEITNGSFSSYSELVGWLILESNLPADQDTARNLLIGLTQATRNYTIPAVTAQTFELAARLMRVERPVGSQPVQEQPAAPRRETPPDWLGPKVYKGDALP